MQIKSPELWPNDWILHHDSTQAHKALSVKQLLNQKSITGMEHPPYSPHLAPNNFWLFPKIKFAMKGRRHKKCNDGNESYSTAGVGLSAQLLSVVVLRR
jgi:hypothetical protein